MSTIIEFIANAFSTLIKSVNSVSRMLSYVTGSVSAISNAWGSVPVVGSVFAALIISVLFFAVFDIVRDFL